MEVSLLAVQAVGQALGTMMMQGSHVNQISVSMIFSKYTLVYSARLYP